MKQLFLAIFSLGFSTFAYAGSAFDPPTPKYAISCEAEAGSPITGVQIELMQSGVYSARIIFTPDEDIEIHRATEFIKDGKWVSIVKAENSASFERVLKFDIPHPRQMTHLKAWGSVHLKNGVGGIYNVLLICEKPKFM